MGRFIGDLTKTGLQSPGGPGAPPSTTFYGSPADAMNQVGAVGGEYGVSNAVESKLGHLCRVTEPCRKRSGAAHRASVRTTHCDPLRGERGSLPGWIPNSPHPSCAWVGLPLGSLVSAPATWLATVRALRSTCRTRLTRTAHPPHAAISLADQ